jgi:hypothetical protein
MPLASPSSSSWYLPRFSAEEMDAALSNFQLRELEELSSTQLPIFELPGDSHDLEPQGIDSFDLYMMDDESPDEPQI